METSDLRSMEKTHISTHKYHQRPELMLQEKTLKIYLLLCNIIRIIKDCS